MDRSRHAVVSRADLSRLFEALKERGYHLVGPTVREGAIVYDQIETVDGLPAGWTDQQEGGTYRLKKRGDAALFGYAVGPHSWKKFLFPPRQRIFSALVEMGWIDATVAIDSTYVKAHRSAHGGKGGRRRRPSVYRAVDRPQKSMS